MDTPSNGLPAAIGLVAAGVALAAAGLRWPAIAGVVNGTALVTAVLAALALGSFLGLRHGRLDRTSATVVAGLASAALVVYAGYGGYHTPASQASLSNGTNVSAMCGGIGVLAAYAAYRDVTTDRLRSMAKATVISTAIGVAGFISIYAVGLPMFGVLSALNVEVTPILGNALSTLALGIGMGVTALLALRLFEEGTEYLDVAVPSLQDVAYAIGGVVGLIVVLVVVAAVFSLLGVESGQHSIVEQAQGNPSILLVMIPASYVFVGPGEELLFRNVIQKRLYDQFGGPGAVVVASAVFGVVHLPAYGWDPTNVVAISLLSLVLGGVFLRTENLLVPAFVHGTFNALQFAALYVYLTGGA